MPFSTKFGLSCIAGALALMLGAAAANAATAADVRARVEEAARQILAEQAARAGLAEPRFVVAAVGSARSPRGCPGAAAQLAVEALDTQHASRMRFVARCASEDWSEPYTVRAEVSALVVIAAAAVKAGSALGKDDLVLERRVLFGSIDEALSDPAAVVGQASRRALRPGQAVDRRMLAEALLVRRGAPVSIVARHTDIVVSVAGQATEAGRRGDIIDVRNAATGTHIRARVIGVDEVEPAMLTPHSPD